ncbi:nicotinate-nucleotide--dimethylbenzimidazole phosphoribosyltransferase [Actinokineospora sp.]|uniref:nicotinate-nucleotide--dimethylbenzimidazole phosphoribosyltransferase n=1 Tax=Actinokineospora sp. TaxID=1872133 RepID=UPI0040378E06
MPRRGPDCRARPVVVWAEVGLGVVPATRSGRLLRDELGAVNASLAEVCTDVLLLVAGLPPRLEMSSPDLAEVPRVSTDFPYVAPPSDAVRREAVARHGRLTKPLGALGRLEELGVWVAACQGQCPPRPFTRPRIVVFAGDHGVARHGVSAYPSEVTGQMVANFLTGGAAINVLAATVGASVRVVDLAVDSADDAGLPDQVTAHKVRRSSGSIDREDALTDAEVRAAITAGRAIADEEVDGGADLLVAGDMGIGNTTPASVLIAALTGAEPVAVVGRGTGIDDAGWMRKAVAIRDGLRRARKVSADPVALLRTAGGADIAAMAAFLAQAAVRRTPVILDGLVSGAAALVAEELAPGAAKWWVAGHRSVEPAHTLVLEQLDLTPLLEMNMRLGEGSGAAAAIPLLAMATRVLAEMATFADAGVTERDTPLPGDEPPTE